MKNVEAEMKLEASFSEKKHEGADRTWPMTAKQERME
jgi:hypothetical protein